MQCDIQDLGVNLAKRRVDLAQMRVDLCQLNVEFVELKSRIQNLTEPNMQSEVLEIEAKILALNKTVTNALTDISQIRETALRMESRLADLNLQNRLFDKDFMQFLIRLAWAFFVAIVIAIVLMRN